jgi:iron(III) transport system substrate-binding protein
VIYTSLDRPHSKPVLDRFEKETGIRVKALYDTEASKTVGLVNRLIGESSHPQADVFWSSEVIRTLVLKDKGVLAAYRSPAADQIPPEFRDPEGYWTGFAARARVLLVNTELTQVRWGQAKNISHS